MTNKEIRELTYRRMELINEQLKDVPSVAKTLINSGYEFDQPTTYTQLIFSIRKELIGVLKQLTEYSKSDFVHPEEIDFYKRVNEIDNNLN